MNLGQSIFQLVHEPIHNNLSFVEIVIVYYNLKWPSFNSLSTRDENS